MILIVEKGGKTLQQKQKRQGQSLVDGRRIVHIVDEIIRLPKTAGEFVRQ